MEALKVEVSAEHARQCLREYQLHRDRATPIDDEIARTYRLISQGKVVIQALESIRAAGLDATNKPKLAIARADAKRCRYQGWQDGRVNFRNPDKGWTARTCHFEFPPGSFPGCDTKWSDEYHSIVPMIPLKFRPETSLEKYHILWEAEWSRVVPVDPMLLRRLGKGDLWLVVAAWDLTPVERAALAARVFS